MQVTKENLMIKTKEESKNFGKYVFEPLPTGFGHTLANALRRVLLTSIKGAAPTQAKVKGANHQFTTLKGVKEDVVEITLNIKKLRFALHTDNPVIATITKKGKGKVTGKDIEISSEAEIMNKNQLIATLADDKSSIEIELVIEPGYGYSPMEKRKTSKVGVVVLDALYSPIVSATYEVEPTRYGDSIDLDKVTLSVETDGSISPKEAIISASNIVKEYYETISIWDLGDRKEKKAERAMPVIVSEDVAVEELPLQTRTINALKKNEVKTLHELAKLNNEEISDIKNLGEKSLEEIIKLLEKEGLRN